MRYVSLQTTRKVIEKGSATNEIIKKRQAGKLIITIKDHLT